MRQQLTPPEALYDHVDRTRVEHYPSLMVMPGYDTYVATETHQPGGSFKARGAVALALTSTSPRLVTASAGSFGVGLSYAGNELGKDVVVHAPEATPEQKVALMRKLGAEVVLVGANYPEAYRAARQYGEHHGVPYASPFDNKAVVAGAVSLGQEIIRQMPDKAPRTIYVPVGGGGLLAGMLTAAAGHERVSVVGVQYEGHDSLERSLEAGECDDASGELDTTCEGSAVKRIGAIPFAVASYYRDFLDGVVTVSPAEVGEALWQESLLRHELVPVYRYETAFDGMPETTALIAEAGMRKWIASGNATRGTHVAVRTGGNTDAARESALLKHYFGALPKGAHQKQRVFLGAQAA